MATTPSADENKQRAMDLLKETDWVELPTVFDRSYSPHLINHLDFYTYRSDLRKIAVYPVEGDIPWPVKPNEQWSQL